MDFLRIINQSLPVRATINWELALREVFQQSPNEAWFSFLNLIPLPNNEIIGSHSKERYNEALFQNKERLSKDLSQLRVDYYIEKYGEEGLIENAIKYLKNLGYEVELRTNEEKDFDAQEEDFDDEEEIFDVVEGSFDEEWLPPLTSAQLSDFYTMREVRIRNIVEDALGTPVELRPDDLILGIGHGPFSTSLTDYWEMTNSNRNGVYYHTTLMIGLRIKNGASNMWIHDYLKHAKESEDLINGLFREWENLPRHLASVEIHIPNSKNAQTADALERRLARNKYLDSLSEAMAAREPFNKQKDLYRKRVQAAKGLHNDLLDDLLAQNHPIPYFLEYPYRTFKRERDKLQKIKSSWHLLDILSKVSLYLIIEELLHNNHPYGDHLLFQLESAPASNGTLIAMLRTAIKDIQELPNYRPTVFPELLTAFENGAGLEQIISKRNRLNHAPFDEKGFLKIMEDEVHDIITSFRNSLSGIQFIVPLSMKFEKGKKIVTAENNCSTDAVFERIEFETTLPLEAFPNDVMMAYRPKTKSVVFLNTLFACNLSQDGFRDFGLFDRLDKHQNRQYAFLRSHQVNGH